MKIKQHADHTEDLYGYRAEDIHEWIDHYFDMVRFKLSARRGFFDGWNPYEHRKHLHNRESLGEAQLVFLDKYPEEIIEKVFLQHIKDDYHGYIPCRADFDDPAFLRKYHRLF